MKTMIPLFLFIATLGVLLAVLGGYSAYLAYRAPAPYAILCSNEGRFTFMADWGEPYREDYATREEAERACEEHRKWIIEYNAKKGSEEDKKRAEKEERAKRFKPCDEMVTVKPTPLVTGLPDSSGLQIYWTYADSPGVHVQRKRGGPVEWIPNGETRIPPVTPKPQDIPHVGHLFK